MGCQPRERSGGPREPHVRRAGNTRTLTCGRILALCSPLLPGREPHCFHHLHKWRSRLIALLSLPCRIPRAIPDDSRTVSLYYLTFTWTSKVFTQCHFPLQTSFPRLSSGYILDNTISFSFRIGDRKKQNTDELVSGVWSQRDLDSHPNSTTY